MAEGWGVWIGFIAFVTAMLALDLGVLQRRAHQPSFRESLLWSGVWIGLALFFNLGIYHWYGHTLAMQFLAGYLIEKSLSVDNLFVFVMVFSWFSVPREYQHRILFWGVMGAFVMRGLFIAAGAVLIQRMEWIIYIFGALLLYTSWKMLQSARQKFDGDNNVVVRTVRRFLPLADTYDGQRLITHREGKWKATPLLLVLLVVEVTDVMFAIDSIPAIFAVTRDPFIVFSSNVFAILGLRALYFLLAGFLDRLHYLKHGLAAVLAFVGAKMLVAHYYTIPILGSLGVIVLILAVSAAASIIYSRRIQTKGSENIGDSAD